ncbi:MAG: leucine-rich repeat domain-containing protein [Lachnospiraceae bacterium]|nr:leucine-rich repeat domain-containing protein [Lachnospiraceae bacterium]
MRKNHSIKRVAALAIAGALSFSSCPVQAAQPQQNTVEEYIYGTINLPYADYYYGELNEVEENATLQLDVADKAVSLRGEGVLDAVSSATKSKWKTYSTAYFEQHDGDEGGNIYGVGAVSVAIPKALYDAAKVYVDDSIADSTQCNNQLLKFVKDFTKNEDQSKPAEYKVLNGDGTLTAVKDSATKIIVDTTAENSTATATISNSSNYGHYGINISDKEKVDGKTQDKEYFPKGRDNLEGALIETSDGAKYALLHLDNLWFSAGSIAFAAKEGFTTHGNSIKYKQFEDIQGKTIIKVTYIIRGGADVEYKTNLLCKKLLNSDQKVSAPVEAAVFADGVSAELTNTLPADSNYSLLSVKYRNKELVKGTDYTYAANTLTVKATENTGVGKYTLTYTDDSYENTSVQVKFLSTLKAEDIKIEAGKVVITDANVNIADYVKGIDSVTVGSVSATSANGIIDEEGNINFEAKKSGRGSSTPFFPEEGKEYEIVINATGYPTVTGKVTSPVKNESKEEESKKEEPKKEEPKKEEPKKEEPKKEEQKKEEPKQATENKNNETKQTAEAPVEKAPAVEVGKTYTKNGLKFKVLNNSSVEVAGVAKKKTKSVTIPATVKINGVVLKVTSIGASAFKDCSNLKNIKIKTANLKKVGADAFKGISKKAKIKVPKSRFAAYKKLLKKKGQAKTVKITK